jgi:hypothetical protein
MAILSVGILVGLSSVLLVSAAVKMIHPTRAATTLTALGVPASVARATATLGIAGEAGAAVLITLWPQNRLSQGACVVLFGIFALAGLRALRTGADIPCSCFGAVHQSTLGWNQIRQFLLAIVGIAAIDRWAPMWSVREGIQVLAIAECTAGLLLLTSIGRTWRRIRGDRRALGSVQAHLGQAAGRAARAAGA